MSDLPDDPELKAQFALAFGRTRDRFAAGMQVFPNSIAHAILASERWHNDPEVKAKIEELDAAKKLVPSHDDYVRELWGMAVGINRLSDPRDRLSAMKLFGDAMNYTQKAGSVNVSASAGPSVLIVKDHGSEDDWEAKAARQQSDLVSQAQDATRH